MEAQMVERMTSDCYNTMQKAANKFRRSGWMGQACEVDELVNEAWIRTVRRLPEDAALGLVYHCAMVAMKRYVFGRGRLRDVQDRWLKKLRETTFPIDMETYTYTAKPERFSYDDVEAISTLIQQLSKQDGEIITARLQGRELKDIGLIHHKSKSRICVKVQEIIRIMNDLISPTRS